MGKRRADSDDEISANGSPASKRARTVDSDDERAPPASARRASKGKARRRDDDDDDDESGSEDAPDYDEEAERKFEEEYEDSIRTALENRRKFQGVGVSLNTH
jgi:hypothetical protein